MKLVSDFYRYRESLRAAIRRLADRPGDFMLDLGCQKGDVTRALPRPARLLVAADPYPWPEWEVREPGLSFVRASAVALPFANSCFDQVVASESLQYVADLGLALSEIRRVLRPGGGLVMSFPEELAMHNWLDPYNLAQRVRALAGRARPGGRVVNHPRARRVLQLCGAGWELERHMRRGSLAFIWIAYAIDKWQALRLRLRGGGGLRGALAEVVCRPPLQILFWAMQLDFHVPLGGLSYNNVIRLRKH